MARRGVALRCAERPARSLAAIRFSFCCIFAVSACGESAPQVRAGAEAATTTTTPATASRSTSAAATTTAASRGSTAAPATTRLGGPSDGGWWSPSSWTTAGEEQGMTDPIADGRYVGIVKLVGPDTISFDLVTFAQSASDRAAAVAVGLLTKDESEIDGVLINRSPMKRVMGVSSDAVLRRLEPYGSAMLVPVPRTDLAAMVALGERSGSAFHVDIKGGQVTAMDERFHP